MKALCQDDGWRSVFTNPGEQALLEWTEAVPAGSMRWRGVDDNQ